MDGELLQLIEVEEQEAVPASSVPAQPNRQRVRRERNIAFSTTCLADTMLVALTLPTIAAAIGEILKHTLPGSWLTSPSGSPRNFLAG